ncbi:MAG TPA: tetratricopeptide repeat protein [Terriglobales bacterium]|nr:tetratricopeptide repeat protein [Terriglobales bacterium]
MGIFYSIFYPYGIILQAIAIVHFIRRRPDGYWLWIVLFGGGLGALVYIVVEVIPDAGLLRDSFKFFPRRGRIHELEALVHDNPAPANLEELGALYLEDGKARKAKECFDRAIASRADSVDTFYRRALAEIELGDSTAAIADLERVVTQDPKYDFHRAAGLLANAYAKTGQAEKAQAMFERVTNVSTATEIQYYYAAFLASQGRTAEAAEWTQRIANKKRTMPGFQKRRDRPWFRKASGLAKTVASR